MNKDRIFLDPESGKRAFSFDHQVAGVFEDMLHRSVPCYDMMQQFIVSLAARFVQAETFVYDLGCSTGETLCRVKSACVYDSVQFVGLDYSEPMIEKARQKFSAHEQVSFYCHSLEEFISYHPASVVISHLTLQFLDPEKRASVVERVYRALVSKGVFIFVEKTCEENSWAEELFTSVYDAYKASQGYSAEEILHKKQALEGVLRPFTRVQNRVLLQEAGFEHVYPVFQWMNFSGIMAIK